MTRNLTVPVWMTQFGCVYVEENDWIAAGLRANPKRGYRKDKYYRVLSDFMELLMFDAWNAGEDDVDLRKRHR